MHVPFFDLRVTDPALRQELLDSVDGVLKHGRILFGPEVYEFEEKVAQAAGTKYALGCSSGSSALYLALRCLDIGPGDEVITTGGALGRIGAVSDNFITLEVAENVDIKVERGAVSKLVPKGTIKSA